MPDRGPARVAGPEAAAANAADKEPRSAVPWADSRLGVSFRAITLCCYESERFFSSLVAIGYSKASKRSVFSEMAASPWQKRGANNLGQG